MGYLAYNSEVNRLDFAMQTMYLGLFSADDSIVLVVASTTHVVRSSKDKLRALHCVHCFILASEPVQVPVRTSNSCSTD